MIDHLIDRHRNRRSFPLYHHPQRVPDEDAIDECFIEKLGRWKVIGCEHRNALPFALHGCESLNRHSGDGRLHTNHLTPLLR